MPAKALQAVFQHAKGAAGAPPKATSQTSASSSASPTSTDPKLDATSPDTKKIEDSLQTSYADDMIGEYIARLETELGVTINQTALNQVIGGGKPGQ